MTRMNVDYDEIAESYDKRYDRNRYGEVRDALIRFVGDAGNVVEVGCGTGHWLAELRGGARRVVGIDASWQMLATAARSAPDALLIRGTAGALPVDGEAVERLFCIHAFHHL